MLRANVSRLLFVAAEASGRESVVDEAGLALEADDAERPVFPDGTLHLLSRKRPAFALHS